MKNLIYCLLVLVLFSCSSSAQTQEDKRPVKISGTITVAADYVSNEGACYTVNVRVYVDFQGTSILVANSNVQVGDCHRRLGNNENSECKDQDFKGDYFFYTKDQFKYCLVDLLHDEVTYAKYVIERNRVIDSIKK